MSHIYNYCPIYDKINMQKIGGGYFEKTKYNKFD